MKPVKSHGRWRALSLSVLLHLLLVAVAVGVWFWGHHSRPPQAQRLAIEATVVTAVPSRAPVVEQPVTEPAPVEPEPEPQPAPKPADEPVPDDAALKAEQAEREAQAAHVAEERRIAEERLAAERKAQEQAAQRKAEQQAREKAEREKADKEKAEKEKAELARKEKEKAQLERAKAQRETELNAQIAAEEHLAAARASGLAAQYIAQITAQIERNWIRPASAAAGLQCEVRVTQVPGGTVTGVQVGRCNGDDAVRQSIEAAVHRASPLPQPADPALFERSLVVTFRPQN